MAGFQVILDGRIWVITEVTQTAHALNRIRDGFSESHFGEEAALWVAMYARDLVNTHIRLILHFM